MADHITSADTGAHDTSIDQDVSQAHGTVVDKDNKKNDAGMAQIKIEHVIPTSGQRKPTTKKEYWLWVIYYIGGQGVGVGNYGAAIQQTLVNEEYPSGYLNWGGKRTTVNSYNLDLNGILFATQLACLLLLGPYADYGNWRPILLIVFTVILWGMTLGFCGLSSPADWQAASALYVLGNLALNVSNTFYWAAFPGLVRDLPKCIESEEQVLEGTRQPGEHAKLDMLERSKLFNIINIVGSAGNLVLLGISTGVAYAIGSNTTAELIRGYRVLAGIFGAVTVATTLPWFVVEQWRPGQKLPARSNWLTAGPKQVWQAAKNAIHLKQTGLYLLAYFLLQDVSGTSGNVVVILQNKTINFSTLQFSGLTLVAYAAGGSGTVFINWVQQRWKLPMRYMVIYGTFMILMPNLWGMIGNWTDKIGYHNAWEFWLWQAWNFQQAAWGSYSVSYISEVVPVNKAYMYFSLFNTVGKTSNFIGPFISSAIINDTNGNNNAPFYFLFFLGVLGFIILCYVDPEKAKLENAKYLERERKELYSNEPAFEKDVIQPTVSTYPVEISEQPKY